MANITHNPMPTVSCPYCGRKYAPGEIFIPKEFFGTATMVDDENYYGSAMNLVERYTCDKCNNLFEVHAEVSFSCERLVVGNFDEIF